MRRWFVPSAETLSAIRVEGDRIAQLARRDPDRPVPQYPGWTMTDLVRHIAAIHGRTTAVCNELPSERVPSPPMPEGANPVAWYEATLDAMLEALAAADDSTPVWGFVPNSTLSFWESRMLIETGVHRWDAEQAFGEPRPLLPQVAIAGLEEFPAMWLPRLGDLEPIRFYAVDVERGWGYGKGEPTATVSGTASDLFLRLMSRPAPVELPGPWATAVDSLEPPPKR
ncbi:MAG: maleylpyruvate isomerase family mycothiol-dependent enzyme [Acidimicrobiia bacterium]